MEGDATDRLLRLEMGRMLDATVVRRPSLAGLLVMDRPAAVTRGGDAFPFSPSDLAWLHDRVSTLWTDRLLLPMNAYIDHEVPGEAFVADEPAIRALQGLGVGASSTREGRLWVSLATLRRFQGERPSLMQFVYR